MSRRCAEPADGDAPPSLKLTDGSPITNESEMVIRQILRRAQSEPIEAPEFVAPILTPNDSSLAESDRRSVKADTSLIQFG